MRSNPSGWRRRKRMVAGAPSDTPTIMPEDRAVAMPADAGAGIIANEQGLNEVIDG